ncbi:unnamed protein product, partial [Scytosiphon promiscuus]
MRHYFNHFCGEIVRPRHHQRWATLWSLSRDSTSCTPSCPRRYFFCWFIWCRLRRRLVATASPGSKEETAAATSAAGHAPPGTIAATTRTAGWVGLIAALTRLPRATFFAPTPPSPRLRVSLTPLIRSAPAPVPPTPNPSPVSKAPRTTVSPRYAAQMVADNAAWEEGARICTPRWMSLTAALTRYKLLMNIAELQEHLHASSLNVNCLLNTDCDEVAGEICCP